MAVFHEVLKIVHIEPARDEHFLRKGIRDRSCGSRESQITIFRRTLCELPRDRPPRRRHCYVNIRQLSQDESKPPRYLVSCLGCSRSAWFPESEFRISGNRRRSSPLDGASPNFVIRVSATARPRRSLSLTAISRPDATTAPQRGVR